MRGNILKTSLLLGCLLSSCVVMINMPKTYFPEIPPVDKPARLVFVNNYNYADPLITTGTQKKTYGRAVRSFMKGLEKQLPAADSLKIIIGDSLLNYTGAGMLTTLLPVETINYYCRRFNAGMLASLDSVNIGYDTRADYLSSVGVVNFYSRDLYLYGEFFLSVYDSAGNLITRSSVDREITFSWRLGITSEAAFDPSLAAAARKIDLIAIPCGQEFADKFRTVKRIEQRVVYTTSPLVKSVGLMRAGKWDEAARMLEEIRSKASGSLLEQALVNLDVAREGEEKPDSLSAVKLRMRQDTLIWQEQEK
ncbi:MAG TPA: DUF6340 family protein [Bacteroidales bacterium]|nr:DUF6340 family protein [Bacteroidales bacterium]